MDQSSNETAANDVVTLTFTAPPAAERLRRLLRGLLGLRGAFFLFVALVPGATLLGLGANAPFPAWALGIGFGLFVFGVMAGALSAIVQAPPTVVVELAPSYVRETFAGRTFDRGWSWIERVKESPTTLAIHVRAAPMKSFRLGTPAPRILLVDKGSTPRETVTLLRRLLASC
jgi:hypothetical protein